MALSAETPESRRERRTQLTASWFEDVENLGIPLLVTMDTFEQASEEMKEWVSGPFLSRVVDCENIRVAIAGQEIPNPTNIEWHNIAELRELYGVKEADHWLPVVADLGRYIPFDNPRDYMSGVCHALKGRPGDIRKVIEGLPVI